QGAVLDENDVDIGVVQGIVGIEQWEFVFRGKANHAGTTPMNRRQDALLAASAFVLKANEIVKSVPGTQVGTVGVMKVEPGAPNVVPGKVSAMLEMRDLSREKMMGLFEQIAKEAKHIAEKYQVEMEYESLNLDIYPALADNELKKAVAQSAEELGYSHMEMPSFAGHDAQDLSKITPMAMIFVPSKDGISHSPDEFTSPEDMARGASVLLRTILNVDGTVR
ncbi:MAG: hydantoinase/carbamoylase family amidase, partial [Cyclobacteriaceae bacterium]